MVLILSLSARGRDIEPGTASIKLMLACNGAN